MKLYKLLVTHLSRVKHFEGTDPIRARNIRDGIESLVKEHLPSGSGIDRGTQIDLDASTRVKLVFTFGYHHMDEHGGYDGWTEHKLYVRPDFLFETTLNITGANRNQVKDHLYDLYHYALTSEVGDMKLFEGETE